MHTFQQHLHTPELVDFSCPGWLECKLSCGPNAADDVAYLAYVWQRHNKRSSVKVAYAPVRQDSSSSSSASTPLSTLFGRHT
jgi:hypothetical protein